MKEFRMDGKGIGHAFEKIKEYKKLLLS